ncbi:MAG: YbaB/EbfC family nucleoid-associated protein [Firmicutes bacterium]|nr:YbaB/EbfC family nucleoid-associated protein [Bacillota bacterium]
MSQDLSNLFSGIQKMHENASQLQKDLQAKTVEVVSDGGDVRVVVNACQEVVSIELNPSMLRTRSAADIQKLLVHTINEAFMKSRVLIANEVGKLFIGNEVGKLFSGSPE